MWHQSQSINNYYVLKLVKKGLASCIFSEYRYIYAVYHSQNMQKNDHHLLKYGVLCTYYF